MEANGAITGGQGAHIRRGPSDALTFRTEARMMEKALREGWMPGERRDVIAKMLEDALNAPTVRDRSAAARVLAAFERNLIAAERNEVIETGQELAAATSKMRLALSDPAARAALVAATEAMQATAPIPDQNLPRNPSVQTEPAVPHLLETPQGLISTPDYAGYGGNEGAATG